MSFVLEITDANLSDLSTKHEIFNQVNVSNLVQCVIQFFVLKKSQRSRFHSENVQEYHSKRVSKFIIDVTANLDAHLTNASAVKEKGIVTRNATKKKKLL
ncbi:hypothetical protein CWI36_0476p0030 [Hamiltosporidium magnivora]|uniref:Uncharacterized protein n=1 Tax=Hamiltosporidium magnivora TaxID=148818 RepID=A0A4Q9LE89_9MICR|nr:hypothetical protein CWI36_0476p0030 [Hamiltosporidium magnivora]